MKELCLYCDEEQYETDNQYVLCGSCIQKIMLLDKDKRAELRKIYKKKGLERRLIALGMFL
jgi:hypothetical protein